MDEVPAKFGVYIESADDKEDCPLSKAAFEGYDGF